MDNSNSLLTVPEVARKLNVDPMTVRKYINDGKLKATKTPFRWRIKPQDLEQFINTGGRANDQ